MTSAAGWLRQACEVARDWPQVSCMIIEFMTQLVFLHTETQRVVISTHLLIYTEERL